ncbi:MAG TPA: DUF4396 domain-containing protein [Segeticoccus sp.]|uniref:DUF4396 domain-containing protein n=1 Tax=Segeticoccus sp. TaxID=2706531 RepID=UPI002D806973|nr:DUF4396 domain-containing protein [Segeticoccus sp.]HET8600959.1 DUF4396 domain-containing protein [Segeticoccus sp.]
MWLVVVAWCALASGFGSAGYIVWDILGRGYRQPMRVMEAVWPITALYFLPLAVWAYHRFGRPKTEKWLRRHQREEPPAQPNWAAVATGVSHCGAGCTLGDIIAEFVIFGLGATIAGEALFAMYVGDYLAAVGLGIVFQYLAIAPMRGLGLGEGLKEAAKADVLSLTAFEVGLFGWMALMRFVFFPDSPLEPSSPAYWFLMQIGMAIGFFTAWPANVWLIRRGIKEAM